MFYTDEIEQSIYDTITFINNLLFFTKTQK